jgi:hypothetical protein
MSEFTNRHGKKVRVSDDDAGVDVTKAPVSELKPAKPKAKRSFRLPKIRISKRTAIILVLVLLIGAIYTIVMADSVKRDYEQQTALMKRTVTERSKQANSSDSSAETVIKTLASSLSASTECKVQGIDVVSWYGPAKQAREDCQRTAVVYKQLQVSVDDMRALAVYMAAMDAALQPALAAPSSGEFAIISDYSEAWVLAYDTLNKLNPPEQIKVVHEQLVEKTVAVRDSWKALSYANGSRDREAFTTAEKSLNERYAEFRTVADGLNASIMTTQKSIDSAVIILSE